jgi:hypothetical protein
MIKNIQAEGQALAEMVLVIPILCLMAAGLIQFSQMFLAKNAFEQACGLAARDYAASEIDDTQFTIDAWENLGSDQKYFIAGSLQALPLTPSPSFLGHFTQNLPVLGPLYSKLKTIVSNYCEKKWVATIQYKGVPIFASLFPLGIRFQTQLAVMKYPEVGNE